MSRRSEFVGGIRAELPLAMSVVPTGLIFGAVAREVGIPPGAAAAMSSIVLAGSAQFVATQLFGAGAPGPIMLLTTFVVNLRHLLYSASLAPHLRPLRPGWKWLLGYLLTDEAYAVTITHYWIRSGDGSAKHWFFLGAGLTLWATWQASTIVGVLAGAGVPAAWHLEFVLPLIFIALVVPVLTDRASRIAGATAAAVAVAAASAPVKLGLLAAAAAGIVAGVMTERHTGGRP